MITEPCQASKQDLAERKLRLIQEWKTMRLQRLAVWMDALSPGECVLLIEAIDEQEHPKGKK